MESKQSRSILLLLSIRLALGLAVEGYLGHLDVVPGLGGVTWSQLFEPSYQEVYKYHVSMLGVSP